MMQGIKRGLFSNEAGTALGSLAGIFHVIIVLLFAFSSIVGNYYYRESNISFINENKVWLNIYRIAVVGMKIFGSHSSLDFVWGLADGPYGNYQPIRDSITREDCICCTGGLSKAKEKWGKSCLPCEQY